MTKETTRIEKSEDKVHIPKCSKCEGRLVVGTGQHTKECPECGGIDCIEPGEPRAYFNVSTCSHRLREAWRRYCARHGYSMQRAVVELMKMAIEGDYDYLDAEPNWSRQGRGQWKEKGYGRYAATEKSE